jgi:hypothetical protein
LKELAIAIQRKSLFDTSTKPSTCLAVGKVSLFSRSECW